MVQNLNEKMQTTRKNKGVLKTTYKSFKLLEKISFTGIALIPFLFLKGL